MRTALRLGRLFFAVLFVVGVLDTITLTRTATEGGGGFSDATISSMLVSGLVGSIVLWMVESVMS